MKTAIKGTMCRIFHVLLILLVGGIGINTFTSCSSDSDDDGDKGGGSSSSVTPSSSSGECVEINGIICDNGSSSSTGNGSSSSVEMCGGEPLPATHFCFEDEQYKLCGGQPYNPPTQFCDYDRTPEQAYKFVEIGSLTWMAENLNFNATGSKCYGDVATNCDKYGSLYNWATAKTACPSGWHLPSDEEWDDLYTVADPTFDKVGVGYSTVAGKHLKATSGWEAYGSIENLDSHNFAALPGGSSNGSEFDELVGYYGYWWSATEDEDDTNYAFRYYMYYDSDDGNIRGFLKSNLYSVRCVRDED